MKNKAVLEGLLFVVGEEGLTFEQIGKIFNCTKQNVQAVWNRFCKRVKNDLYV